jgi:WD40 repeat protein
MRKHTALYLVLALLGWHLGSALSSLTQAPPKLELDFGQACERAALSPDGRYVAGLIKTPQGWRAGVADLQDGLGIEPVPVPDPPARAHTFSWHESSRWVAFGCADQVRVFDTQKRSVVTLPANPSVRQVLFRGDLLLARADQRVYLWNVKTGKLTFQLNVAHLLHADLTADGKTLAVGSFGEGVKLVGVPSKRVLKHLAPDLTPASLAFCKDDRWLAAALRTGQPSDDHARLFDVPSGRQLGTNLAQANLRGMAVSLDGERLLLRSDNLVSLWQPATGQKISSRQLPATVLDALSPDGLLVASAQPRGSVIVWSAQSGETLHELPHPAAPTQVHFATTNRLEVVGDRYRLWWIR